MRKVKDSMEQRKVVVIDDESPFLLLGQIVARSLGFQCFTATNGASGLRCIEEIKPDIIICDYTMPEMNGYEVWKAVRENPALRTTPFILFSGLVNTRWKMLDKPELEEMYQISRHKEARLRLIEKGSVRTELTAAMVELLEEVA